MIGGRVMRKAFLLLAVACGLAEPFSEAAACGRGSTGGGAAAVELPAPGASLTATLEERKPEGALKERAQALGARVAQLVKAGKTEEAYAVEEEAMKLFGLSKVWLRCGPGTFGWAELPPPKATN
jgi:hypothetical protein